MKNESEKQDLLKDILNDDSYAQFRIELYRSGLHELQGRRRKPVIIQYAYALAACIVLLVSLMLLFIRSPRLPAKPILTQVIGTVRLKEQQLIRTRPEGLELISTEPHLLTLVTEHHPVPVIRSESLPVAHFLPDAGLLELFRGHSIALVTTGPSTKVFMFLDPEDQDIFWRSNDEQN